MNKAFSITTPLDAESRKEFLKHSCEFLDGLVVQLKKQSDAVNALVQSNYDATHAYQKFGYGFDAEDETSPLGHFTNALSSVGQMGVALCTLYENHKKEIDSLLRRSTEMRTRLTAFQKTFKPNGPISEESKNALELLKLDFVSEILDQCVRMFGCNFKLAQEQEQVLKPIMETKIPQWSERSCQIQQRCLQLRDGGASIVGDAAITRGTTDPVFGSPLEKLQLVPGFGIPQILFDTTQALLTNPGALEQEGLFRESARAVVLNQLKAAYDAGQNVVLSKQDPNVIAGLLKKWLRELPEPLISSRISIMFSSGAMDPVTVKRIVQTMPPLNRRCLHKIMEVLCRVSMFSGKNKMTKENLSIVFGPIISRRDDVDATNPATFNQVKSMTNLVVCFIAHYGVIFGPFKA